MAVRFEKCEDGRVCVIDAHEKYVLGFVTTGGDFEITKPWPTMRAVLSGDEVCGILRECALAAEKEKPSARRMVYNPAGPYAIMCPFIGHGMDFSVPSVGALSSWLVSELNYADVIGRKLGGLAPRDVSVYSHSVVEPGKLFSLGTVFCSHWTEPLYCDGIRSVVEVCDLLNRAFELGRSGK